MPIIDMHTHSISKRVDPLVAGHYDPMDNPYRRDMSPESRATDAEQGKLLPRLMLDVAARREVMQRMGVDFQVIAPAPAQQHYWAGEELQVALSRIKNEDVTDDQAREKIARSEPESCESAWSGTGVD